MFSELSNTACNTNCLTSANIETMHKSIERLYLAGRELGLTNPTEVARRIGVSQQTMKNWESRGISRDGLTRANKYMGVNIEWVETGRGTMFVGKPTTSLGQIEAWDSSTPLHEEDVEVPLYKEVEMAAGEGTCHSVEINGRTLRFARSTLKAAGVEPANAACATVTGNSMERLIMDGATIGIDRGRTQIKDGKIYAIDHCGMLRVKAIYRAPGGGLRLHSENDIEHPDELYSAEQVASDIKILGSVFWVSQVFSW